MDTISTLILDKLDEGSTSLGLDEIVHTIKAVCGSMGFWECEIFDAIYAHENDYAEYIVLNNAIELSYDELDYHDYSFGSLFKRTVFIDGYGHHRYIISIPPSVSNIGDRVFTLGHELGHILLHGRLLIADQKAPKKSLSWFNPLVKMPLFMELEANIFSLHNMMPKCDILDIYSRERSWASRLCACKEMMMDAYGEDLPSGLAESRLLTHDLGNDDSYENYIHQSSYSEIFENGIEWLVFGQARRIRDIAAREKENTQNQSIDVCANLRNIG